MLRGGLRGFQPPTNSSDPRQVIPNKHTPSSAIPLLSLPASKQTPLPIRLPSQRCLQRNSRTDLTWVQKERSTKPKGLLSQTWDQPHWDLHTAPSARETCLCKAEPTRGYQLRDSIPIPSLSVPPPSHIPIRKKDPGLKAKSPGVRDGPHETGNPAHLWGHQASSVVAGAP